MRFLSSSSRLLSDVFHCKSSCFCGISQSDNAQFESFPWEDAAGEGHVFRTVSESPAHPDVPSEMPECISRLEQSAFQFGIVESYSESSQYDRLRDWRGPGVFALALDGKGFHGQYTRTWHSIPGNLFLCLAVPVCLPVSDAGRLQQLPAEIIRDALNACIINDNLRHDNVRAEIKPPNDVVIRRGNAHSDTYDNCCKIAGTLTDMRVRGDMITQVRYGIGMNIVDAPGDIMPGHLPAISLCDIINIEDYSRARLEWMTTLLLGIARGLTTAG